MHFDQADIFLVPLLDGSYGVGQVFEAGAAPLCGLTGLRQDRTTPASPLHALAFLSFRHLDPAHLTDGTWPIIGFEQLPRIAPTAPADPLDPAVTEAFLNALHGLYPWDGFPDPAFFDGLLRDGITRPEAARLKAQM